MAEDSGPNLDNRLWRLEQQHKDALDRMTKVENRLSAIEGQMWRIDGMQRQLDEKKTTASAALSDSTLRQIIYGLIAGFVALASGQAINFTGLLK